MTKNALITGITGQDGAYLAKLLLGKGYRVFGTHRHDGMANPWRLEALGIHAHPDLALSELDLTDLGACIRLLQRVGATEVYNLAAQSYVMASFDQPSTTGQITGMGALNLLEAIRIVDPGIRYFQASSSEMFGKAQGVPQTEDTPFHPRSPYGVAKLYAHWMTVIYRESFGIHGSSGILFNHESPLRPLGFVTRKISHGVAGIHLGAQAVLELGNLDARRDWGYAEDYVEGMWRMLQADEPVTCVLATGRAVSVREFADMAFRAVGLEIEFRGAGLEEVGVVAGIVPSPLGQAAAAGARVRPGQVVVTVNPDFYRPAEAGQLVGDASRAGAMLDWRPGTRLEDLCRMMVATDLERIGQGFPF